MAFFELPTKPAMGVDGEETLNATKHKLIDAGLEVLGPVNHTLFKSIYFFDPNGHRVELACDIATDHQYRKVGDIAPTLQAALDDWEVVSPKLQAVYQDLNDNRTGLPFDQTQCHSPLPRAYQWADGSAYLNHVELVRKARQRRLNLFMMTH